MRRVPNEFEIPVLGMMEVGEAAVDERSDEVEREGGPLVAAQQQHRIRHSIGLGELDAVDDVAAVAGQADAIPGFDVRRTRLGVLAGEPTHPNDPPLRPVDEHERHLEEDLQLAGDDAALAFIEALGAVASLEEEAITAGSLGELAPEALDLP
jgi:hypothetical protein